MINCPLCNQDQNINSHRYDILSDTFCPSCDTYYRLEDNNTRIYYYEAIVFLGNKKYRLCFNKYRSFNETNSLAIISFDPLTGHQNYVYRGKLDTTINILNIKDKLQTYLNFL